MSVNVFLFLCLNGLRYAYGELKFVHQQDANAVFISAKTDFLSRSKKVRVPITFFLASSRYRRLYVKEFE